MFDFSHCPRAQVRDNLDTASYQYAKLIQLLKLTQAITVSRCLDAEEVCL